MATSTLTTMSVNLDTVGHGSAKAQRAIQIQNIIENFDLEVNSRVALMQQNSEMLIESLRFRLEMEVNKLPRAVLELKMGEFIHTYNGDVQAYFAKQNDIKAAAAVEELSATIRRSTRRKNNVVDATPKTATAGKRARAAPATATESRTGTIKRGRPAAPSTVAMTPMTHRNMASLMFTPSRKTTDGAPEAHTFAVSLSSGQLVELDTAGSPSAIRLLSQEARDEVKEQLSALQVQLSAIMSKFE